MYKRFLVVLSLAIFVAAAPKPPAIVTILESKAVEVQAGSKAEFVLNLQILKGFHIQANPASEPYLIATTVKVEPSEGITAEDPVYPKGIPFQIQGSKKEISTYEGEAEVKLPIQVKEKAPAGEHILKGTIRYQGCDTTTCYPPATIPFEAKIQVK